MTHVECPAPECGRSFPVERERIGRNVYCIYCGTRMTARPAGTGQSLRDKQRQVDRQVAREATRSGPAASVGERLPLRVIVDNVRSLWNVGSIFRTADACGVERLDLCGITGTPPRREIEKTALGAEGHVEWRYWAESAAALVAARADGYTPVVLETGLNSVPVDRIVWPSPCCLIVGNEVAGVGLSLLDEGLLRTRIEMRGVKESLNVAVAFGIAAHAAGQALVHSSAAPSATEETET